MPLRLRLSLLMFLQWAVPGALLPLYSIHLNNLGFSEMAVASCCAAQASAVLFDEQDLIQGEVALHATA
jgi:hypothetical protein